MNRAGACFVALVISSTALCREPQQAALPRPLDLWEVTSAEVVIPEGLSARENRAVSMLVDEVRQRTAVRWTVRETGASETGLSVKGPSSKGPSQHQPRIVVGPHRLLSKLPLLASVKLPGESSRAEGYQIAVSSEVDVIVVSGNDERGVLFGVGRLLRELRLSRGRVAVPSGFSEASAPELSLRGHQLGYRPKTNSYDAWDAEQWEQYYRDLAIFGTNAIELIPPRSDDDADSPHFPVPPLDMMEEMSRLADDYGLDVWIWYPAMDPDYGDPKTVESALKEWEEVYRRLPRIDVIFVPGGDPGDTQPVHLMNLLEKQAALLRKYHPAAQMWMSPQGFSQAWDDEFYAIMRTEPKWLNGIVFGPQVRQPLEDVRKAIPRQYPVRGYPDITHSINCQHPVPGWDTAFAMTQGREVINPRPLSQATIFEYYRKSTIGFLTYSEGCNDDVNKFVWSGLGWDSRADVREILRQYSRWFIADQFTDTFAEGLLALERNWQGPLLTNSSVETTLQQFQQMERSAGPILLHNWRFQQALYRAYYDACLRDRLIAETAQRAAAEDLLRQAARLGSLAAMNSAEDILNEAERNPVSPDRRSRTSELAEALFQSIRMQLNTGLHQGQPGRGTSQQTIDVPLNDRNWLKQNFARIRKLAAEEERLQAIHAVVNRTNPGPGGFYDDLGDPARQPHLVRSTVPFEDNPDFRKSVFTSFDFGGERPREWWNNVLSLYDAPLEMEYTGLEAAAKYRVRIVYSAEPTRRIPIQMQADGQQLHEFRVKPDDMTPLEFDIPQSVTQDGHLRLRWTREPGHGGNGRGCQVAEVFLLRL